MVTDINGFINQTIDSLIPFNGTIEVWNETLRDYAIGNLTAADEAI